MPNISGIEIARSQAGIFISQKKYLTDIVMDVGFTGSKVPSTPLPKNHKFDAVSAPLDDPEKYRRLVGRLLYLNMTRPDISYSVQQLSQFLCTPYETYWLAALHFLRYLRGTSSLGLFYSAKPNTSVEVYCDSDWAACPISRKSLSGYCVFLGGSLVSWKTKKQNTVSRSSCEAEYRSMGSAVCELQWVCYLLHDLQVQFPTPIPLWCDSQSALHITENPVFHERTKHLEIDCHIVRNKFKEGFINPVYVSTHLQLADVLTKSLGYPQFTTIIARLGMVSQPIPP
ncbi:hypothetical protein K2173_026738 [Erythroxylum novogranatense]|uniref:Copia protein n=1 Tax=Erythroxylum novogranatense TaxID=1862640 RepID=A0AAV8TX38_9ROSI|nr:hypothetical protein K2173_026738 [Erythroxylum novogranatense]